MTTKPSPLHRRLVKALRAAADPKKAAPMQAYMKSVMPFHGVPSPVMKQVCREVFADYVADDFEAWRADVLDLWRNAEYREERYAAIALSAAKKFQTLDALPVYEEMIVDGAWWDYVDVVAEHRICPLFVDYPKKMRTILRAWSKCDDMWKRRTSIICQVPLRGDADLEFLYSCIEPSLGSKEFFLRKAIGWALRSVAWHDPDEIICYVADHAHVLSGLSQREALKNVARIKTGAAKKRR